MPRSLHLPLLGARRAIVVLTRSTLEVIAQLERSGCQVLAAHVLPHPAVRVDRAPEGLDTWGHLQPPPGGAPYPTEHVAQVRGVRVTWFAVSSTVNGGRHV